MAKEMKQEASTTGEENQAGQKLTKRRKVSPVARKLLKLERDRLETNIKSEFSSSGPNSHVCDEEFSVSYQETIVSEDDETDSVSSNTTNSKPLVDGPEKELMLRRKKNESILKNYVPITANILINLLSRSDDEIKPRLEEKIQKTFQDNGKGLFSDFAHFRNKFENYIEKHLKGKRDEPTISTKQVYRQYKLRTKRQVADAFHKKLGDSDQIRVCK